MRNRVGDDHCDARNSAGDDHDDACNRAGDDHGNRARDDHADSCNHAVSDLTPVCVLNSSSLTCLRPPAKPPLYPVIQHQVSQGA